mgnify:CR=1 FL=1
MTEPQNVPQNDPIPPMTTTMNPWTMSTQLVDYRGRYAGVIARCKGASGFIGRWVAKA